MHTLACSMPGHPVNSPDSFRGDGTLSRGEDKARPGRPGRAGLIHCVFVSDRGPQGTGATRGPLGSADLDRPLSDQREIFIRQCPHECPHELWVKP